MIEEHLTVANEAGFHVRPATLICKAAMRYQSNITLRKGSEEADCKSCLDLLALMAPLGTELVLRADGEDEKQAFDAIRELFDKKFYEDEFASEDANATASAE